MQTENITLGNKLGLHTRAAAKLVELSSRFSSQIELSLDSKKVNAKSILNVMLLSASSGSVLTITAEGVDENEAMAALKALFDSNFGEE
ncbi:MAG: ptsH [Gammaproteobacteria bacterium]|jgi:phosphocarrier protein|nr:ptsH [Gammaproteobacteria bacterium]